jgi:hypothetical protein
MYQNHSRHDYRSVIALAAFVLFAFVLLAALLMPGAIPLVVVLPALIAMLRMALQMLSNI